MGAVINCTSYEKEAARTMEVQLHFHRGSPEGATSSSRNSVTLVTQLSVNR